MLQKAKKLPGYDNRGIVYDAEEFIIREVDSAYLNQAARIFEAYIKNDLSSLGIVQSTFDNNIFKHKKHTITYPYEWTASMFKDSVVSHLNLFIELDSFGLTLKDAIPSNILFNFTQPIFVDFLSLVFKKDLINEDWLIQGKNNLDDKRFLVYEEMFLPFLLIPFFLIKNQKYELARKVLCYRACNVKDCKIPKWKDLRQSYSDRIQLSDLMEQLKLFYLTRFSRNTNFKLFAKKLLKFLRDLDVTPPNSDYDSYFQNKNENFSFENKYNWKNKQKNIYQLLKKYNPKTVLDLGANTGWFSILAAKLGSNVIATDIDESSIDLLYRYSKERNLNILSLFLPFEDLEKKVYGIPSNLESKENVLFLPATERLNSDFVMCLALAHHLVLGMDKSINYIVEVLAKLTNKVLVLEYISLDDPLIKNDGSFFKYLSNYDNQKYNLDSFVNTGKKYFKECEIFDSHPETRKLLVFEK